MPQQENETHFKTKCAKIVLLCVQQPVSGIVLLKGHLCTIPYLHLKGSKSYLKALMEKQKAIYCIKC